MIAAETSHVAAGAAELANRALAAALLELGLQPSPRTPGRVAFWTEETEAETTYAVTYGHRDWSHSELVADALGHVAEGALWVRAADVDVKTVAGFVTGATFRLRPIN